MDKIPCRKGCGACCIAPSISAPLPGMPCGKPAGVRCLHLSAENLCTIYGKPERPKVCVSYQASREFCGENAAEALERISSLEAMTSGPMGP